MEVNRELVGHLNQEEPPLFFPAEAGFRVYALDLLGYRFDECEAPAAGCPSSVAAVS